MRLMPKALVRFSLSALLAAGLLVASPSLVLARHLAPRPRLLSRSWQIKFIWHAPSRLFHMSGGGRHRQLHKYWFVTYTVTNTTRRDLFFIPTFQIMLDGGGLVAPKVGITPRLYRAVKRATGNPFLIDPDMVSGKLLQGADNAKDSFAIFSRIPSGVRGFKIFISGLSGETAVQKDPLNGKPVVLHKTLVLDYRIGGHAINLSPAPILVKKYWVMR